MTEQARPIAVLVDREGLGDVMLKVPFLRALRRTYPGHDVWWIATHQTSMADELRPMFASDVARVVAGARLNGPPRDLLKRLAAFPPFELVFDSRTRISTVALTRLGLQHRGFYACLPGYILSDGTAPPARRRPRHIAERMLSLMYCATGKRAGPPERLEASEASHRLARELLPDGPTYVGIAPGSRQKDKNWPVRRFAEVAQAIAQQGVTPVVFLGPQEGDVDAEFRALAPAATIIRADASVSAAEALDRLVAQGQRLTMLLANDNGVGHLLGASGVPVVSLFGPTDPARWAPVAPRNVVLRAQDFGGDSMEAIPTAPAVAAVMSMLGTASIAG